VTAVDVRAAPLTHEVLTCLNDHEARTIDAMAGRILPGDADDPGAREAGAVLYIDRALAGAYAEHRLLYRTGVAALDARCHARHGHGFAALAAADQDAVLSALEGRLAYFFAVVREHVIQGTFCDPVYGGNRDAVGWRLLGFPGAYWGYGEGEHGTYGFDAAQLPIKTLADLRRERAA
jgi:gluconate 2-dehydrogenase gamma chain